jgi:hypothetical protein
MAVAPTPAVLPIRQTSNWSRPAGIDVPVPPAPPSQDAFHQPAPLFEPMVPIAVPAPPTAPPELAAPVAPALDPAAWGLDIEALPATGRRRGSAEPEADRRRKGPDSSVPLPARLLGRGKAGAARLLVLALVVGAEGVAVTAMGGHATPVHTTPTDTSAAGASGAFELSAELSQEPEVKAAVQGEQTAQLADNAAQVALAQAQSDSSRANKAKVVAALQQAKAAADRVKAAAERRARAMRNAQRDPKSVASIMVADRGWNSSQFSCLVSLWNRESMWNFQATNPSSGAYGIAQALPGSKMASAGPDWRTNPVTQIRWGLDYISDRYGSPCGAWGHSQSTGWY